MNLRQVISYCGTCGTRATNLIFANTTSSFAILRFLVEKLFNQIFEDTTLLGTKCSLINFIEISSDHNGMPVATATPSSMTNVIILISPLSIFHSFRVIASVRRQLIGMPVYI